MIFIWFKVWKKIFIFDGANDCCPCLGDEPSRHNKYIDVKGVMVTSLLLMSNLYKAWCLIYLFVAVPSSLFSTTNPGEEAAVSQPHLIRSTTGGWQKQEELKRWEQEIETVQPEKSKGEHQIFKELDHWESKPKKKFFFGLLGNCLLLVKSCFEKLLYFYQVSRINCGSSLIF